MQLTAPLAAVIGIAQVGLMVTPAAADHSIGLRSESWSPLTAGLAFGGLALLAGAVVVIVVTVLTRRDDSSSK